MKRETLLLYLFYVKPSVLHVFYLHIFRETDIIIFILQVKKGRSREGK